MRISDHVDAFVAMRQASALLLSPDTVTACAIAAVRLYAGWAALADPAASDGITADVDLTNDEWGIVDPLFRLYVDRESALVIEASSGLGVQPMGRTSSEVAGEIQQAESQIPLMGFVEDAFVVGLPAA